MAKNIFKCLVVDDDELVADILRLYIKKVPNLVLVGVYTNTISAREKLIDTEVDILFLDVEIPKLSGIELLKTLPHRPHVVLMSGNKDYAVEGFNLDVDDFILKPVSFERFLKAVSKVEVAIGSVQPIQEVSDTIYVNENRRMVRIDLNDIYFIESIKDYSKIALKEKQVVTHQPISQFEKELPSDRFLRIHRSVIVAIGKIESFSASSIDVGIADLPVGSSYKAQVQEILKGLAK